MKAMIATCGLALALLAPAAAHAAAPTPVHHIRIHAIFLQDPGGGRAGTVTAPALATTIVQMNQIFAGTGIQFDFDAGSDAEVMQDAQLNSLVWGTNVDFWTRGNQVAARYPNKLVIFFRWGTGSSPDNTAFAFPPRTGAPEPAPLDTPDVHFIAYMNNLSFSPANALAHEVGHYLGLYHTFPGWNDSATRDYPSAFAAVQAAESLDGLDGDYLGDTPADAGRQFYLNVVDGTNLCSGKSYKFKNVIVGENAHGVPIRRTLTAHPDHLNPMSYFYCSPGRFSPQQAALMRATLQHSSRSALLRPDLVTFRPETGLWKRFSPASGDPAATTLWGMPGDVPVPGDYDRDGTPDLAIWRPGDGNWWVLPSRNPASYFVQQWGTWGDVPVPADYDGDGFTDFAVWRPSDGVWYVIASRDGAISASGWGWAGDVPVPGDYDGDHRADLAVWRPSEGNWYVVPSSTGVAYAQQWGIASDVPVARDYDGDGRTDLAVWRPSEGNWYVVSSSTGQAGVTQWGTWGDVPVPSDYDGDGRVDVAVWRESWATWFVIPSTTPWAAFSQTLGAGAGDLPLVLR